MTNFTNSPGETDGFLENMSFATSVSSECLRVSDASLLFSPRNTCRPSVLLQPNCTNGTSSGDPSRTFSALTTLQLTLIRRKGVEKKYRSLLKSP